MKYNNETEYFREEHAAYKLGLKKPFDNHCKTNRLEKGLG
jgi:hypothetical protein